MAASKPATLGELRSAGYAPESVKQELRRNVLARLRAGRPVLSGLVGYEDTVVPQVVNAILADHDFILLGERGQAKSRLMRSLVELLDEEIPIVLQSELNDDPFAPISPQARDLVAERGEATPIDWLPRDRRYGEKLATPDISIPDLIGEVDPIRVAEGRYLSDELTLNYGLIPRCNRGIFAINELPDLAERIQVGLLNIMEEKDVQIRGHLIRLPLDLLVVASANPEDYTSRGRIITPLKDRFGAQVRTHYPLRISEEIAIMEQEASAPPPGVEVLVPAFMKEILAELTHLARRSPHISQSSGVSVRMSIANFETLEANAVRRAARLGEPLAVPRISDLEFLVASTSGRVEIEALDEGKDDQVVERIRRGAVSAVFGRHFSAGQFDNLVASFDEGEVVEAGEALPAAAYERAIGNRDEISSAVRRLGLPDRPEVRAAVVEFLVEGLHLAKRLNKDEVDGRATYRRS
ncbi:MAG: magnesium chelatase [Candidatus Dormiibacterota bacterium]